MLFFDYDEFEKFISKEEDLKFKLFFEFIYYCGLRRGEENALNWHDINLHKATININ